MGELSGLGKWLIAAGLTLVLLGAVCWIVARLGIPVGRLPGDFYWKWERGSVWLPLGTCLVVSLLATLLLNLWVRLLK